MPIYEYYCVRNNTIYQFFAKTLSQGQTTPKCPDNPAWPMKKLVSSFAVGSSTADKTEAEKTMTEAGAPEEGDDSRMEAAMNAMEREFDGVDENDPRAMARMMRRMAELTGEKIDGNMEEVVRKLEEGEDVEALEEKFGTEDDSDDNGNYDNDADATPKDPKEAKYRFRNLLRRPPRRDPNLYDYE